MTFCKPFTGVEQFDTLIWAFLAITAKNLKNVAFKLTDGCSWIHIDHKLFFRDIIYHK